MAEQRAADGASRGLSRRLFFALWPDEAMRQAMADATRKAARASGGRPVPASNLHVTLAFLGSVPEGRLADLAEAGRAAALCPALASAGTPGSAPAPAPERGAFPASLLELAFDHLQHWRAAQLLCALPSQPSEAAAALAQRLRGQLAARGFSPDLKPFRPHVTVVRKVSRPGRIEKMHAVVWSFTDLALMESRTLPEGPLYSVVESYSLCSHTKAANNSEMP